jgi:hypothetical protein
MTASPASRPLPDQVSVVEVDGSKFLLEWLDWEVLAASAALCGARATKADDHAAGGEAAGATAA